MNVSSRLTRPLVAGRDYPKFEGRVKIKLHNPTTGKNEVIEHHNAVTNALADIFAQNYGGLLNYNNFADLFNTWLGGVLVFENALDVSTAGWADNYGIPASTTNKVTAHAGRTPYETAGDDSTRGNPLETSTATVLSETSTKLTWEWGTSQGNGTIASLGLTHTDVGSYGCGVTSDAQKLLNPFAQVSCLSKSYTYGDDAVAVLGINNNTAYTFYLTSDTTVDIFKTPINNLKFKLQGGSLAPLTDYTTKITATLPSSYERLSNSAGQCYYYWDFENNALILFGVPNGSVTGTGGTTLYKDVISLSDGTVTHTDITVTGATLWKFTTSTHSGYGWGNPMQIPTKAMIFNNHLFVYGNELVASVNGWHVTKMFIINLANTADITQVNMDALGTAWLDSEETCVSAGRFAMLGEIIAHESYLINGDKFYPLNLNKFSRAVNRNYGVPACVSSPVFGINDSYNALSVCKLYLATKFNLPSPVVKSAAQSMTIEYTLTETA